MLKRKTLLLIGLFTFSLLTGCGEDKELTEYKDNMDTFYTEISAIEESINAIVPESEDAVSSLLANLEEMEVQFQFLADINVPEEFSNIEELADDAAAYMTEAVSLYNQTYSDDSYNESFAAAASENYQRAMKRVNIIASLLQGEIPEGVTVITTEEEGQEFEPYTEENTFEEE